jgi:cytochrome P450
VLALLADAYGRNPYPIYAVMRRVAPVVQLGRRPVWALFDYASVKMALDDHARFSSRAAPPGGAPLDWLIFTDPPRHSLLRSLISRTFTPRSVAALEPRITSLANELLDAVAAGGRFDLVTDFAERLPVLVIMDLLGMPRDDSARVTAWGAAILQLGDTVIGGARAARAIAAFGTAKAEMRPYLASLLAERRDAPRDDLLSRLLHAEVDGARLGEEEIFSFFQLLLLAGTETTTNLIANAVLCFMDHRDQLALVRRDRSLLPAAIEEVVRFRAPAQHVFRAATAEIELHGRRIPAGGLVLAMIGSANRDPRQFAHPNRFDVARQRPPHVGFGHGIHYCVGAGLARLEARVALSVLLDRFAHFEHAGRSHWVSRTGLNIHGPRTLPLRVTAAH